MRKALFLLLFPLTLPAFSQRITGKITDTAGNPVEYVNIGVENSQTGMISDENGRFSLTVPDSLASANLYISHISYETKLIPVRELPAEEFIIELTQRAFAVPEIVVRPGRYRKVEPPVFDLLFPTPGYWTIYTKERLAAEGKDEDSVGDYLRELGASFRIKDPMLIDKVYFEVSSATDSLLIRVNAYSIENDTVFTPLHTLPLYVMITPTAHPEEYAVDVSEAMIVAPAGKILITLQQIRPYGGVTYIRLPARSGTIYSRTASDYTFKFGNYYYPDMSFSGRVLRH